MANKYTKEFEQKIIDTYEANDNNAKKTGRILDKDTSSITRVLRRNNIPVRTGKGEDNAMWKGGRGVKCGYWTVYSADHPRKMNNNRVYEHILVAEMMHDRSIDKSEPIHHIDFDKLNNDPNNLYVCRDYSEHNAIHGSLEAIARDLVHCGLVEFKDGKYQWACGNGVVTNVVEEVVRRLYASKN